MNNVQYQQQLKLLPLIHNISFCKLATRIQDALAGTALLKFETLVTLDADLVRWHEDLPTVLVPIPERGQQRKDSTSHLGHRPPAATPSSTSATVRNPFDFSQPPERDNTACPDFLKTPRAIMHWRYQNLRMLMHRPFLLATSLRRTPYANLTAEEKVAVGRCRIIAGQTISDINITCPEELIAGWNAVWLMYQAVMVPLVSLFSHLCSSGAYGQTQSPGKGSLDNDASAAMGGDEDADRWCGQIETAMVFFDRMIHYSVAAKKSKDVVERLYEASKHLTEYSNQQPSRHNRQQMPPPPPPLDPNLSPSQFLAGANIDPFTGTTPINLSSFTTTQQQQQDNNPPPHSSFLWAGSPNGDAAMNSFWDDMMWDTFPTLSEMPGDAAGLMGMGQYEWLPLGGQPGDPNAYGEAWGFAGTGFESGGGGDVYEGGQQG